MRESKYKSKVGDLVCLIDHTWGFCGYGIVLKVGPNNTSDVYWYELGESTLEYNTDLSLCEKIDMKKCLGRSRLRSAILDKIYS